MFRYIKRNNDKRKKLLFSEVYNYKTPRRCKLRKGVSCISLGMGSTMCNHGSVKEKIGHIFAINMQL